MKWTASLLFFCFAIYLVAFPKTLRPELILRPFFSINVEEEEGGGVLNSKLSAVPFELADTFGYVTKAGDLLHTERKLYGVAIDANGFINYSSVSGNLVFHDVSGRVVDTFEVRGYPVFLNGRFFILSTNRSAISEMGESGRVLWKNEYSSIITDFDSKNGRLAIALLDGRVLIIDAAGDVINSLNLQGSRIRAVYGCELSADGNKLAVIHGLDPQILSVFDYDIDELPVYSLKLKNELRRQRRVGFLHEYLFTEDDSGIIFVDPGRQEYFETETAGRFAGAGILASEELIWVLSRSEQEAELMIVHLPDRVLIRAPFRAEYANAAAIGDKLYLGLDRYMSMMAIAEQ